MDKTIGEVRQEILKEYGIDISKETIRRDEELGIFSLTRDKENDYRVFTEGDVITIKFLALLREIGVSREKFKEILEGNQKVVWERLEILERLMPKVREVLR